MEVCNIVQDFPGGSDGKASAYNVGDPGSILGWEDSLEKEMATTPVFLPGESHGGRSLVGYHPRDCKELESTERLHFSSLQCPPIDNYSVASCNFGALTGGDEYTSF